MISKLSSSPISILFFFSSRRRHTRFDCDWSSDVCSSDLRVDNTLEAFARVKARCPEATLTVAGYGPEEDRPRRPAPSLAAAGIRFTGPAEPEAMAGL